MTQWLSDVELVGKVYAEMLVATGHDWPARNAAIAAWRRRYPTVEEEDADLVVAHLIVEAIDAGLVWENVRLTRCRQHSPSLHLGGVSGMRQVQDFGQRTMTQTEKFIARLHHISAGAGSLDRKIDAVAELFARFLGDVQRLLGEDRERSRSLLTDLQFQLTNHEALTQEGHFADVREHARKLVRDWLLKTEDSARSTQ